MDVTMNQIYRFYRTQSQKISLETLHVDDIEELKHAFHELDRVEAKYCEEMGWC